MKTVCILWCLLLSGWSQAQSNPREMRKNAEPKACNADVTFCWYGSDSPFGAEVRAWGNRWVHRNGKVPAVDSVDEIRCIKALMVCILASNRVDQKGKRLTSVDIYRVTNWETTKVEARPEADNACREISLRMEKIEQVATLTSRPRESVDAQLSHFCSESPLKLQTLTATLMQ